MTDKIEQFNKNTGVTLGSSALFTAKEEEQLSKLYKDFDYRITYLNLLSSQKMAKEESDKTHVFDLLNYTTLIKDRMLNYAMSLVSHYQNENEFHKQKLISLLKLMLEELDGSYIVK